MGIFKDYKFEIRDIQNSIFEIKKELREIRKEQETEKSRRPFSVLKKDLLNIIEEMGNINRRTGVNIATNHGATDPHLNSLLLDAYKKLNSVLDIMEKLTKDAN